MNDDSVIHALKLIHPKLESQLLLAQQVALIGKLQKGNQMFWHKILAIFVDFSKFHSVFGMLHFFT